MRVSVEFQQRELELEIPDENLVGVWQPPAGATHLAGVEIVRARSKHRVNFHHCARPSSPETG